MMSYSDSGSREQLVFNAEAQLTLLVSSPSRENGLTYKRYTPVEEPSIVELLSTFLSSGLLDSLRILLKQGRLADCPEIPVEHVGFLQRLNLLVPEDALSQRPLYEPLIEKLPDLLPQLAQGPLPETLVLNPAIYCQSELEPTPDWQSRLPFWNLLSKQRPVLWVQSKYYRSWFPYWLDASLLDLLNTKDSEVIQTLSLEQRYTLYQAHVLIEPSVPKRADPARAQAFLENNQYLILRGLIPAFQMGALRAYLRKLWQEGFFQFEAPGKLSRGILHNEPVFRFFQHQIYHSLIHLLGLTVRPSYNCLAVYPAGVALPRHLDREQCIWNMSVVIDMQKELKTADTWPIYLETSRGIQAVHLNIGDALLYSGTQIPHWRETSAQRIMVALFHFVDLDFEGSLN